MMIDSTPTPTPTPTPFSNPKTNNGCGGGGVYHVGGIPVQFPYQPYGSQLAFMGRVLSTLDRARNDGHCHALLESPTGTGKSLSLLCSTLAWQHSFKSKNIYANLTQSKPNPQALSDPLGHGGGFVPDTQPQPSASGNLEPTPSAQNGKTQKKKTAPTIFYASRTHSQISQVIREYRKTTYRVPMAVLASRKHYCTNANICGKDNIDEQCKLLLKGQDMGMGCSEFKNVHKVKSHPSVQKGGCHEAHDIEDLVKVGQVVKGCSYYAARSMAEDAQLVFCPYSYIINPIIRAAMEVDIKGAIVILDEAHNIEDISREAGSMDLEEDVLDKLQTELQQLCQVDVLIYQPLYEMTQDIMSWIRQKKDTLDKREFQHYYGCWTGDKALRELEEANISLQCFPILKECANKAIKAATDKEATLPHLSGMSVITLEGLFSSLTYFFSGNGIHIFDYQLALQRYVKKDAGNITGRWTYTFSLWCLNPAIVFNEIASLSLSVILTSGTLSPMNSFSSELGVQFGTNLEAPHVIDVDSQLWAAVIPTGPGNYPMNASYKTADGCSFQDTLGKSIEEVCKVVPGGALVFFPSYKLMEKLCSRWRETGQFSRLNAQKPVFIEPRGGNQEDFEPVLKGYYRSINQVTRPAFGRKKKGKKTDPNHVNADESQQITAKKGAAFLAVCRGKVSEGIDFSDDNARVVIVVGIPFPNINDIQIGQKKKYNDTYRSSKNLLSGNEWYCQQAFRALNQAAGRCIRHRFDYGAIIFLDERFREKRNLAYVSKWLKNSIKQYDNFEMSMEGLKSFFNDAEEKFGNKSSSTLQNFAMDAEREVHTDQGKGFIKKKSDKLNKSAPYRQRQVLKNNKSTEKTGWEQVKLNKSRPLSSLSDYGSNFSHFKSQFNADAQPPERNGEKVNSSSGEFDGSPQSSRYCPVISLDTSYNSPEVTHVMETPDLEVSHVMETPEMEGNVIIESEQSLFKDEDSSSTIIEDHTEFPNEFTYLTEAPSKRSCSVLVTPEKNVIFRTSKLTPGMESSLNLSVNSQPQKRRRSIGSPSTNLLRTEVFDAVEAETSQQDCCLGESPAATRCDSVGLNLNTFNAYQSLGTNKCDSTCPVMDKSLQIYCGKCRNPLGLHENHLYVACSLTSSSKVHLASLMKETLDNFATNKSNVDVVISDISSVNQRLCNKNSADSQGEGVWSQADGCVFNTIYCPFCKVKKNCLGVQIVATDASNVQLLNKMLFYVDCLEIRNLEPSEKKGLSNHSDCVGATASNTFEKFSYKPKQNSGGWRTTKSKLSLPRRALISNSDDDVCGSQKKPYLLT